MRLGLLLALLLSANPAERVGKFKDKAIVEPSGIVASRVHPGIFWIHNDSGNPPALFAVRVDGTIVRRYLIEAVNVDWEDIAIDDSGHLYLGDIGDNLHTLPVHAIHRIDEPDPLKPETGDKLKPTTFYFRYPKSSREDAEGLFIEGNRAVVVTKRGDGGEAELFTIPLDKPAGLLKPIEAKRLGSLSGSKNPVTGTSLSTDGRRLAVCSIGDVRIYRRDADGRWLPSAKMKSPPGQVEAIAWSDSDLILSNEDREIFRIPEKTWKAEVREKGKKK